MKRASFRFYAELNDFLPPHRRMRSFDYSFYLPSPIKDVIEGLGVPHTEVDLILVNGNSVEFSYLLQDGDHVSVYPVFESIDITPVLAVRAEPLRETRFVLDTHLGRLAAYLRVAGFDTVYNNHCSDAELSRISAGERRILLTRDRGLLKRSVVTHGCYIRETNPRLQLVEVLRRFDLARSLAPFSRCLRCNGVLQPASKESVMERLPSNAAELYEEFWTCDGCARVYWKGSHYRRMRRLVDQLARLPPSNAP